MMFQDIVKKEKKKKITGSCIFKLLLEYFLQQKQFIFQNFKFN